SCRQRRYRRWAGDGACARKTSGARRAVPPGKHRVGTWPSYSEEFSRHRCGLECVNRPASAAPDARPPQCGTVEGVSLTEDFKALIAKAATGATLSREEAARGFERMMAGEATPSQMGGLLMALRVRGET